jgi:FdhD protein
MMRHPPRRAQTTQVLEWEIGHRRHVLDDLVGEEPLEIRVNGTAVSVTMRTPGDDFELAAGFLFGERLAPTGAEIRRIAYGRGAEVDSVR